MEAIEHFHHLTISSLVRYISVLELYIYFFQSIGASVVNV